MNRFILLSFAFLGFGFYELSGGSGFDPETARSEAIEARQAREMVRLAALDAPVFTPSPPTKPATTVAKASSTNDTIQVTRNSLDLVSIDAIEDGQEAQASDVPSLETTAVTVAETEEPKETLSIAALENDVPSNDNFAFSGNKQVASSNGGQQQIDIRSIKGDLVNMRSGPGTDYDVVDQLAQATQVEVLTNSGNGWVELRPLEGGATGWIAEFLLTDG